MDTELYTWKNEITCSKLLNMPANLNTLAKNHSCGLEGEHTSTSLLMESVKFTFTGTEENLEKLTEAYKVYLHKIELSGQLNAEYKVNEVKDYTWSENNFNVNLVVDKSSKIKDIPTVIAEKLDLDYEVVEKSNGFLKGKTVSMKVSGHKIKLEQFVNLVSSYITLPNKDLATVESVKSKKLFF